jgi:hypothetical protein
MNSNGQTSWRIAGDEVGNCNCDWGCPCQFDALPTHGNCMAMIAYQVNEGSFGDTSLEGVRWAWLVWWPGPIHEGDGVRQMVVDESATREQREAIEPMLAGKHGGGYFEIFASVMSKELGTVYAPIEVEANREERTGSVRIGELAECTVEPIKNPVTGDPHRVRIDLPDGFEYRQAEIGNTVRAKVTAEEPLSFTLENTYAQLNPFDWSND